MNRRSLVRRLPLLSRHLLQVLNWLKKPSSTLPLSTADRLETTQNPGMMERNLPERLRLRTGSPTVAAAPGPAGRWCGRDGASAAGSAGPAASPGAEPLEPSPGGGGRDAPPLASPPPPSSADAPTEYVALGNGPFFKSPPRPALPVSPPPDVSGIEAPAAASPGRRSSPRGGPAPPPCWRRLRPDPPCVFAASSPPSLRLQRGREG